MIIFFQHILLLAILFSKSKSISLLQYPTQLLVIVICFTYTCISPVILPVGAIYFGFAFIVYKKQIMYLYTPRFESGGASFPLAMHRTLVGMICGQITLIGYFFTASTRTVQVRIFVD